MPVSYTHLDVYKRQDIGRVAKGYPTAVRAPLEADVAVHLGLILADVYKRQR